MALSAEEKKARQKTATARWRSKRPHYAREYYWANRAKMTAKSREWDRVHGRRRKYGLTHDAFCAMLAAQNGRCAICCEVMSQPHLDHDHKTGAHRGLLCGNCNRGIGIFRESTDRLRGAIAYLERHGG